MELPHALAPWQQSLSIFPRDLAIALGGIIDKLSLLVGPLVSPDAAGRNEPDGFEGIGRRGSFERLLASEWALAEEAPLEFLRRVSTGELSFLEIAHQKPTLARQCVVLFDVGPDQRGGPRIVHLAALILLAQRARAGGASYSWGILQDPTRALVQDVNEESVRTLVAPGQHRQSAIEDIISFYQAMQDDEAEVWFVGGMHAAELTTNLGACRVEIDDSMDPDAPSDLHVTVVGHKRKPRSVQLVLPPGNLAVRLLRDPFRVAQTKPQKSPVRIAKDTNIVFSRDYAKLFLQGAEGELLTIPIPNSPNWNRLPNPRVFRPPTGERIVGVGRLLRSKKIAVMTVAGESAFVHQLSPRLCTSIGLRRYAWEFNSSPLPMLHFPKWFRDPTVQSPLGQLFQINTEGALALYDGESMLHKLEGESVRIWTFPVSAVAQGTDMLHWFNQHDTLLTTSAPGKPLIHTKLPETTTEVYRGPASYIAARIAPTKWEIVDEKDTVHHSRDIAPECKVLGFARLKEFTFYVLDPTRTRIIALSGESETTCYSSAVPIKAIHATPACWLIAFVTEDDELFIYSSEHQKLILRMRLGAR